VVPSVKKPPKKKIYNGLWAMGNAVILLRMLYQRGFQGNLPRSITM